MSYILETTYIGLETKLKEKIFPSEQETLELIYDYLDLIKLSDASIPEKFISLLKRILQNSNLEPISNPIFLRKNDFVVFLPPRRNLIMQKIFIGIFLQYIVLQKEDEQGNQDTIGYSVFKEFFQRKLSLKNLIKNLIKGKKRFFIPDSYQGYLFRITFGPKSLEG